MAYFPNGTSSMMYEEEYCDHCVHQYGPDGNGGCQIWWLHLVHNDAAGNDKNHYLHKLIPNTKDSLGAEKCTMFFQKAPDHG
jgi:hypothetical protein